MIPIQTGLCAFGMSGQVFHGPLLQAHPDFILSAVCKRSAGSAPYPGVNIYASVQELFEDPNIELVIVNTPEETHFDFAKSALEAGKHVVVEKAFTVSSTEAEKLIELSQQFGKILTVFHNRRWDSDFLSVQSIINQGLLGRLVEYEAHYDRYRNYIQEGTWKELPGPGHSIVYNLGSHLIDQALCLFDKPTWVWADIRTLRTGGLVEDYFEIVLGHPSVKISLKAGYLVRIPGPKYTLHGINGSFVKSGMDPQEQALKEGKIPGSLGWGLETEKDWGSIHADIQGIELVGRIPSLPGNYLEFYTELFQAIRYGKMPPILPETALLTIRIIEAAYASVREGRKIML